MRIDIREHPDVIDMLNNELSNGNIVELKFEKENPGDAKSDTRLAIIRIERKVKHFEKLK